jgi:LysR family transcriptional regulator, transcription activator of glutamate synthase operon
VDVLTLRCFVSVADGATVGDTAAAFHASQPAVTRALQRLSAEVGGVLTERAGRRLRLTAAGRALLPRVRRALAEIDEGVRAVADAHDPAGGTVRLGFLSPLGTWLVPDLLQAFRLERPRVRFELRQDGADRILQALEAGDLDLLLSSPPSGASFAWEPLFREELVLTVPPGHRLASRRRVRVAELSDETWVLHAPGYGLRRYVDELCAAAGFEPQTAFEGHDLATLLALIAAGSGIGLFPATTAGPGMDGVRQVHLSPPQHRQVGIVRFPGSSPSPSAIAFVAMVRHRLAG